MNKNIGYLLKMVRDADKKYQINEDAKKKLKELDKILKTQK